MTDADQVMQPDSRFLLARHLTPLLLLTVALFFAAIFGVGAILQGKIRLFISYWQCLPCLLMLPAAWLLRQRPGSTATAAAGNGGILPAVTGLLALSPFPTWFMRSTGNLYFELCCAACLAMTFLVQLEICRQIEIFARAGNSLALDFTARKTRFMVLCFEIIPVCALYASGIMSCFTGSSRTFREILRIWSYGRISLVLRLFLFWGLLQVFLLCLYASCLAAQQVKQLLEEKQTGN